MTEQDKNDENIFYSLTTEDSKELPPKVSLYYRRFEDAENGYRELDEQFTGEGLEAGKEKVVDYRIVNRIFYYRRREYRAAGRRVTVELRAEEFVKCPPRPQEAGA